MLSEWLMLVTVNEFFIYIVIPSGLPSFSLEGMEELNSYTAVLNLTPGDGSVLFSLIHWTREYLLLSSPLFSATHMYYLVNMGAG